jgi:hypothetical protein
MMSSGNGYFFCWLLLIVFLFHFWGVGEGKPNQAKAMYFGAIRKVLNNYGKNIPPRCEPRR